TLFRSHGSQREDVARARQGQQGAHCSVRRQGAGSARGLLAGSRTTVVAGWTGEATSRSDTARSNLSKLCRPSTDATLRRTCREKIRSPRERELGFASALAAACIRHTSACRWRRPPRNSGTARPPVTFDYPEVHARFHPPADGYLRQGPSSRVTLRVEPHRQETLRQKNGARKKRHRA